MTITPDMAHAEQARRKARKAGLAYAESVRVFLGGFSGEQRDILTHASGPELILAAGLAATGTQASAPKRTTPKRKSTPKPKPAPKPAPAVDPAFEDVRNAANAVFTATKNTHGLKAAFQARKAFCADLAELAA